MSGCSHDDNVKESDNIKGDTSYRYFSSDSINDGEFVMDTSFLIYGTKHHLRIEAQTHKKLMVNYSLVYKEGDSIVKEIYKGYDCTYSFSLSDASDKLIYKKVFHKSDFKELISFDALVQTNAILPKFMGYNSKFQALLFSVSFWIPNSGVGNDCFLMLDTKGEVIEKSQSNYYGGCGCSDVPTTSEDSSLILTCSKLISSSPVKSILLDNKAHEIVAVKFISNEHILVIYEHDTTDFKPNAFIIDREGRQLCQFEYRGYYCTLNNWVPMTFLIRNQTYYLLDNVNEKYSLLYFSKTNPTKIASIPIDQFRSHVDTGQKAYLPFELSTIVVRYKFYMDTITNTISVSRN